MNVRSVQSDPATPRRVVIVGGGFAGLFAARALRGAPVRVTVVDRVTHHLFQPLLYQCATGILSEGQIAVPLRKVLRRHENVECLLAEVTDVDVLARRVRGLRPEGRPIEVGYDDLIVCTGMQQSYFGNDEFARFAPGMKTLADALTIRRRIFGAFEMADTATDPDERRRWLTFALVGAGPTGVELAGQIHEVATHTLRDEYRNFHPEETKVMLFDGGKEPLASFGTKLAGRAAKTLTGLGVELHMRSIVTDVDARGLEVKGPDGETRRYDAGTVLWTAGVSAPAIADRLAERTGADQDHAGRLKVQPDLTLPGHPEISVVGDLMSLDDLPGVAEVAMQTGFYAGRRIRHQLEQTDEPHKPFRYRDLGSAAYISRGQAVVSVGPFRAGGIIGWLAWLAIHLTFITTFRNRLGALLSWAVVFSRERRRERAVTMAQIVPGRDLYHMEQPPSPANLELGKEPRD